MVIIFSSNNVDKCDLSISESLNMINLLPLHKLPSQIKNRHKVSNSLKLKVNARFHLLLQEKEYLLANPKNIQTRKDYYNGERNFHKM